jgi:hypothetical protein
LTWSKIKTGTETEMGTGTEIETGIGTGTMGEIGTGTTETGTVIRTNIVNDEIDPEVEAEIEKGDIIKKNVKDLTEVTKKIVKTRQIEIKVRNQKEIETQIMKIPNKNGVNRKNQMMKLQKRIWRKVILKKDQWLRKRMM